jgi:hypothetical protein
LDDDGMLCVQVLEEDVGEGGWFNLRRCCLLC